MKYSQHQHNELEQMLRELAAHERRSVRMDDAMAERLEARFDACFYRLQHRGYMWRHLAALAAALLLALGCLSLLNLPETQKNAPTLAVAPPEMISATDWDKHFPPAEEPAAVTRNGIEYRVEAEEDLPFTIDDCYL